MAPGSRQQAHPPQGPWLPSDLQLLPKVNEGDGQPLLCLLGLDSLALCTESNSRLSSYLSP